MNSQEELDQYRIREISDAHRPLLGTVDWVDNSVDTWIECVDDNGDKVRLVPDMTGWQDRRKEVMVMNTASGVNTQLFFTQGEFPQLHDITLRDPAAYQVMAAIPAAVLRWAVMRAK